MTELSLRSDIRNIFLRICRSKERRKKLLEFGASQPEDFPSLRLGADLTYAGNTSGAAMLARVDMDF